jgi:hypothetical protein
MVTPAVSGYVQQLGDMMPDILNVLGRRFLKFNTFQFEIINSDINDRDKHVVAVSFFSEPMIWHETVDNYLLVSPCNEGNSIPGGTEILTNLFQLQSYLNIHAIKLIS